MTVKLRSHVIITKVPTKTTSILFKHVEVGDILYVETDLQSCNGYVPMVRVVNQTKAHERVAKMTQISQCMDMFEYTEVRADGEPK